MNRPSKVDFARERCARSLVDSVWPEARRLVGDILEQAARVAEHAPDAKTAARMIRERRARIAAYGTDQS